MSQRPRRWDLVLVDLGGAAGREQHGMRPALVVSNDGFNRHFPVAAVLPLTKRAGNRRRVYPFEVLLPAGSAGNDVESVVMPHQVRTISLARVVRRLGSLRAAKIRAEVEARLLDHLGIGFDE